MESKMSELEEYRFVAIIPIGDIANLINDGLASSFGESQRLTFSTGLSPTKKDDNITHYIASSNMTHNGLVTVLFALASQLPTLTIPDSMVSESRENQLAWFTSTVVPAVELALNAKIMYSYIADRRSIDVQAMYDSVGAWPIEIVVEEP